MDFFAQSYIDRDQIPKAVPCQSLSAVKKVRLYLLILFLLYSSSVVLCPYLQIKNGSFLMYNTYIPFQENCSCDGNCDLQEIGENAVLLKGKGIYHVKIPHLQSLSYEW